ncbi:MAG TPA: hypothetical protein PLP29_12525 [Candidatus Ozemobacteraceae bacterium]|nr:hypothetical protein [Candidatus Ozemobacteraceae bacterium]
MSLPLPVAEAVSPISPVVPSAIPVEKSAEKPHLTLVTPPAPEPAPAADPTANIPSLLTLYKSQHRECWLCEKIAGTIEKGKDPSEDDKWHFATCVLSWAALPTT